MKRSIVYSFIGISLLVILVLVSLYRRDDRLRIPIRRKRGGFDSPSHIQSQRSLSVSRRLFGTLKEDGQEYSIVIPMKNYFTVMYTGVIQLGNPSQEFNVVFDTGSADLWVFSQTAPKRIPLVNFYDHTKSETWSTSKKETPFSVEYGIGKVKGIHSLDCVSLGGLLAPKQNFGEITSWTENFENNVEPMDGIVGMAFREASMDHSHTLIDNLYLNNAIPHRVFSFHLGKSIGSSDSTLVLGSPDPKYFSGEITYVDLVPDETSGMWFIPLQSISIGSEAISACARGCIGLVDTGSSFIGVPQYLYRDFVALLTSKRPDCERSSKDGQIICSFMGLDNLPVISIQINGRLFELTPEDYMVSNHVGVMELNVKNGVNMFILGDTFLKTFYTVFDMDNRRVGFANSKNLSWRYPQLYFFLILGLLLGMCIAFSSKIWGMQLLGKILGKPRRFTRLNSDSQLHAPEMRFTTP